MDAFLDDEIGESSKLLPDLLRGLRKKENLLQCQVQEMIHSIYVFMSLSMQWVCCLLFARASKCGAICCTFIDLCATYLQLSGIESKEGSGENDWQRVVADAKKTMSDLAEVKSRCNVLVKETSGKEEGEGKEGGTWMSTGERDCVKVLQPLVRELVQLERLEAYLLWLRRLQQIRYGCGHTVAMMKLVTKLYVKE